MSAGVREEVMRLVDSVLASSPVADVPTLLDRCLEQFRAEQRNAAQDKAQQPAEVTAVDVSTLTAAAAILGQPAPTEVLAVAADDTLGGCPACRGRHRAHTCGQPWKAKKRPSMADEAAGEQAKRLKALGSGIPYAAASALARPLSSNLMASALLSSQMPVQVATDAAASAAPPPFAGVALPHAHAQMVAIEDIDD